MKYLRIAAKMVTVLTVLSTVACTENTCKDSVSVTDHRRPVCNQQYFEESLSDIYRLIVRFEFEFGRMPKSYSDIKPWVSQHLTWDTVIPDEAEYWWTFEPNPEHSGEVLIVIRGRKPGLPEVMTARDWTSGGAKSRWIPETWARADGSEYLPDDPWHVAHEIAEEWISCKNAGGKEYTRLSDVFLHYQGGWKEPQVLAEKYRAAISYASGTLTVELHKEEKTYIFKYPVNSWNGEEGNFLLEVRPTP